MKGKVIASEYRISYDVCIQLVGLLHQISNIKYHLYTDNWYTALSVAEVLLSKGTNLTGTVRGYRTYTHRCLTKTIGRRFNGIW